MDFKLEAILDQSQPSFLEELPSRFLTAAKQIAAYAKQLNIDVLPAHNEALPIFRSLEFAKQVAAVEKVEVLSEVYSAVLSSGGNIGSASHLVWMACNKFGFRPPSDFFGQLRDDDVIEVYCQDNIHQFSNLRFFEICSYTLEQIYCYPWPMLWHRNEDDITYIQGAVGKMMQEDTKATIEFDGPIHIVTEIQSSLRFQTNYALRCGAPLFCRDTKEKKGYIVCEAVSLKSKLTGLEEEKMLQAFEDERTAVKQSDNVIELSRFLRSDI